MKSNRRSVLIGLGALTVGGGAVFGTGAFSTVEAERSVTVDTDGDSDALLSITAAEDYEGKIITDDDEIFELDIGGVQNGNSINRNARTVLDDLVVLTNQGTQDINTITFDVSGDGEDILEIQEDTEADMPLETEEETMFGIEVDLLDDNSDAITEDGDIDDANFDPIITITAETDSAE